MRISWWQVINVEDMNCTEILIDFFDLRADTSGLLVVSGFVELRKGYECMNVINGSDFRNY